MQWETNEQTDKWRDRLIYGLTEKWRDDKDMGGLVGKWTKEQFDNF